jgi:dolichol-phosphate mannosyltransferase
MSGFFLISRGYLQEVVHRLSGIGFKILLDLVASSERPLRIVEIPYVFRNRLYGESKLDISVAMEYLVLLVDKLVGYTVPTGFALFSLVGGAGLVIQLAVLGALYRSGILSFTRAQIIGVFLAMISNFLLNNAITHRSNRLHTISSLMRGFAAFVMACSLGALANVATSRYLLDRRIHWIVAALVGIVVGSVWNYSVTAVLTWHVGQRRARQAARAPTLGGRA